jgi:capsular polysaccharide biosynthesis protein
MEEMYKVTVLERMGFQGYYVLHSLPEYPVGWLDLFGVAPDRIIRQLAGPTIFRSALFTTGFAHEDVSTFPGVFSELRDTILAAVPSDDARPASGRRLWLERGANTFGGARDVVNAEEVRQCCDRYGFTAIDLGSLPARDQVAAVRDADVLAGPHGAALVHAMWLREHATVVECFSPKHNNPSIFEICRLLRHRYFQLVHYDMPFRPYNHGDNVLVDLSHLNLTFEEIERG